MTILEIKNQFEEQIKTVTDAKALGEIRNEYISKKGIVSGLMKQMKDVEDKKAFGQEVNELKTYIAKEIQVLQDKFEAEKMEAMLKAGAIDVSISRPNKMVGKQNILIKTAREIEDIFFGLGYEVVSGPEVETDYYNFDALNLGPNHPARDMQDTFFINENLLLRTHTSNTQSRFLSANPNQEIKILCPGKVYRRDDDDATHSHQFMQTEGLVVVKKENSQYASLKELKTTLTIFVRKMMEDENIEVRMRSSFFPFTEPSVEVDVTCSQCHGDGCSMCKQTGWIEILGAGIVHRNVLANAGYDADEFTGFAFGIGVDRIALLKHGIEDIRNIYTNDQRFLDQF
ncbi:phenylalanine--tRNA ligase subunit alpha [Mollicutes bacterium LVI A0078]|nr:phenylalanine--tRNA ligase subunit alpha [Mollicutes bacterium LVI A0075]WOO90804.1 phenylalanine--tRNA ligase subunit alpha [Mollicutes bacterium LVI A0078]